MTFEEYVLSRIIAGAGFSCQVGKNVEKDEVSIMTSDEMGTRFWSVKGDTVKGMGEIWISIRAKP